jgi:hypothetical protein
VSINLVPAVPEPEQGTDTESWEAFWAEIQPPKYETIAGVEVKVPTGLTLAMVETLDRLADQGGLDTFRVIGSHLFGAEAVAQLAERLDLGQWAVLTMWGLSHAKGTPMTFRQARDAAAEMGKAPEKPTSARRSGSATGGRSKRTSPANTA